MTGTDVVVGVAFGLAGAGLLLVWCLLRIAARADHDAPAPPPKPAGESDVAVLQSWLDRSQPAAQPALEAPVRLLPVIDPAARAPYDHERGARLLEEIDRVLADIAASTPVEAAGQVVWLDRTRVTGESVRPLLVRCEPGAPCSRHNPIDCRHAAPCCGACPTVPTH